jgi:hypothetical protein
MTRNLGAGCAGLIVLLVIIVAATSGSKGPSTPATADKSPQAQAVAKVLLDLTGSGTKTTNKFRAAGDWDLSWSYDCSTFGQSRNFQVYVYNGDGSLSIDNSPVNQLGKSGADVEHYHHGGTFYLVVNSECSWHVTAKG